MKGVAPAAKRMLALALAALIVAWAPGFQPYQALAAEFEAPGKIEPPGAAPLSPIAPLPAANLLPEGVRDGSLPLTVQAPNLAIPTLPASAVTGNAAVTANAAAALVGNASPEAARGGSLPLAAVQSLRVTGESIARAKTDGETRAAIETLFTGGKAGALGADGAVLGSESPAASGLTQLSVSELRQVAASSHFSPQTRVSAVKAIADRSSDPARLALAEIGAYDAGANAEDYEVKRQALRALKAQTGDASISLPAVGEPHKKALLEKLSKDKPAAVVYDYHGTLEENGAASAQTAQALAAGAAAGVETMVLTGGPSQASARGGASIFDQLATLTPAQKTGIEVGSDRGAEIWAFDAKGRRQLVDRRPGWTKQELALFDQAGEITRWTYGTGFYRGQRKFAGDYEYVMYLPDEISEADLGRAAALMQSTLARFKLQTAVAARRGVDGEPPHLVLSKYDKATGVSFLLTRREAFERLRDAKRWLSPRLAKLASPLLKRLPSHSIPAAQTVLVGDDFLQKGGADLPMLKAAPGATALAVGGVADPDYDNVFVMPGRGRAATLEIAGAIAAKVVKTPEEQAKDRNGAMDVKATAGWTISSAISIVVFVLVSLAHPLIAQHFLGGPGLALVMALGPVVSILSGPLNGRMANKMTMRNGMALNAILRAILLLDMPTFMALGMVNFWTLALGAMANGWLLSAIMATEGAYMKSFGGPKNIGTIFAFAQSRYLIIQVVMNLLIGVGSLIDRWNVVFPAAAFLIASITHAVIVTPIIIATIPNKHIDYRQTGEQDIKESFFKAALRGLAVPVKALKAWIANRKKASSSVSFFKKITRRHLVMGLALASFVAAHLIPGAALAGAPVALLAAAKFFNSPLLLTGSILYWISGNADTKTLFAKPKLRRSALLIMLGVAMMYPIQYVALPMIALGIAGAAAKGALLSSLMGALFFGQLVANGSKTKLPVLRVPFIGRFGAEQIIQKLVLALAATWVGLRLFPGNIPAMLGAAAIGYALTKLGGRISDRGAVKLLGVGMAVGLAAMALGFHFAALQIPLQFLGLVVMGMAYSLGFLALNKYQMSNAEDVPMGTVSGVNGSFLNSGISLGYGGLSLLAAITAFPGLFVPLGVFFGVGGLLFFLAPGRLPGLPANIWMPKEKK